MDLRNFFRRNILSPAFVTIGTTVKTQMEVDPSPAGLRKRANNGDLRLIVERQFMRMNEAHERRRTEVLASYSPAMK